jgi:cell division septation protein DedD
MDTAMRDLERIEERSSDEGRGVLVLSGVGLVAAIAVVVAAVAALPDGSESQEDDPLQMLTIADELETEEAVEEPVAHPAIDPETLSFPTTLVTETRPEVAAAMAAAAAELAHLDPLTTPPPRSDIAAGLPAAVTAGPDRKVVEMAAVRDPLVAATVPDKTTSAPAGHEGRYTLQVISYRDANEAQVFKSALRKRGHAAYVTTGTVEGRGTHWRVRIGPFESRQEAQDYRTTFEREEGMNTFIVRNKD